MHVRDGHRHPMKYHTHQSRANDKIKADKALKEFYERGKISSHALDEEDFSEAIENMKVMSTQKNSVLCLIIDWIKSNNKRCVCASCEAE